MDLSNFFELKIAMVLKNRNVIVANKKKVFILKRTVNNNSVAVIDRSWKVPGNRRETINILSQNWWPPVAPENFKIDPEQRYTAITLIRASEYSLIKTNALLQSQTNSGGFKCSFVDGYIKTNFSLHLVTFRTKAHLLRNHHSHYNMNNRRNNSLEFLPSVFELSLSSITECHLAVGFQSISDYLQQKVSNHINIVTHPEYSNNVFFQVGKTVGLRCLERASLGITAQSRPQNAEYLSFIARQSQMPVFILTKLKECFTLSHFLVLITLIDAYTHIGGVLLGYSLHPFLLAFLGPTNFFPLYKFLYERDDNGNYLLVEALKSVLLSLETNLMPNMASQILDWIERNELSNPLSNCFVYYLSTYRTKEASGISYVSVSQGISSQAFLSFENLVMLNKFFPYKPKKLSFALQKRPSCEVCEGPTPPADQVIAYEDLSQTIQFFLDNI